MAELIFSLIITILVVASGIFVACFLGVWRNKFFAYLDKKKTDRLGSPYPDKSCVACRTTKDLHSDHIIPLTKGGADHPDNLQWLCARHNLAKSDRMSTDGRPFAFTRAEWRRATFGGRKTVTVEEETERYKELYQRQIIRSKKLFQELYGSLENENNIIFRKERDTAETKDESLVRYRDLYIKQRNMSFELSGRLQRKSDNQPYSDIQQRTRNYRSSYQRYGRQRYNGRSNRTYKRKRY